MNSCRPHINSQSALLTNNRRLPNDSVYMRLHNQALNKQKIKGRKSKITESSYEASSLKNESFIFNKNTQRNDKHLNKSARTARYHQNNLFSSYSNTPSNYGEKLYINGMKKIEERERRAHKEKIDREIKECEDLTFHPQINQISRYIGRTNNKKLEDQLIEKGKKSQDIIEKKRSEILFEKQNQYSFHPKINKKSERMVNERSKQFLEESAARFTTSENYSNQNKSNSFIMTNNRLDKFMLLYDDAIKRKERKDHIYSKCLDSECTFQPDIIAAKYSETDHLDLENLVDRLSKPPKGKNFPKIKYIQEEKYDKQTGQPLFHPKVGRPPLMKKDSNHTSITDKLYNDGIK